MNVLCAVGQKRAAAPAPGRRVVIHILCCMLVWVLLAVPAFAVTLPEVVPEGGDTVLGIFTTSSLSDANKQFLRDWMASDRNMLIRDSNGHYEFLIVPDGVTVDVSVTNTGVADLFFLSGSVSGLGFLGWDKATPQFNGSYTVSYDDSYNGGCLGPPGCYLVTGTVFKSDKTVFPMPTSGYLAEFDGTLYLRDDGGLFGSEDEGGNWWDNLLDWLASFWDKLKAFFIGLFVPESGFFSDWFNEIKEAFENKLGGIGSLYECIRVNIDFLKNYSGGSSGLPLNLPKGFLYDSFDGFSVNLLSYIEPVIVKFRGVLGAIVVALTGLFCYRKLLGLVNT